MPDTFGNFPHDRNQDDNHRRVVNEGRGDEGPAKKPADRHERTVFRLTCRKPASASMTPVRTSAPDNMNIAPMVSGAGLEKTESMSSLLSKPSPHHHSGSNHSGHGRRLALTDKSRK